MSEVTIQIGSAALAVLFGWAGAAKLLRWRAWRDALRGYRLPANLEAVARSGVILIEVAVVGLLVAGQTRAGAALVLALLSAFSLAVLRARALEGDRLPCGCFGGRHERDYRTMIARNGVLGGLAAGLLASGRDVALLAGVRSPTRSEALPLVLVAVGVAVAAWTLYQVASTSRRSGS